MKLNVIVMAQLWGRDEVEYTVSLYDFSKPVGSKYIKLGEVEIDWPEVSPEDLIPGTIEALRNQQAEARAAAEANCQKLDEEIQKLLALSSPTDTQPGAPDDDLLF